jgi:ELWxxDGT repeat protein
MPSKQQPQGTKQSNKFRRLRAIGLVALVCATALNSYFLLNKDESQDDIVHQTLMTTSKHFQDISPCVEGGEMIYIGFDSDENGRLDDNEIDSSTLLCHGFQGLSGPQGQPGLQGGDGHIALLDVKQLNQTSTQCNGDGIEFSSGLDLDDNGMLEEIEVVSSSVLCNGRIGLDGVSGTNGSNGFSALVEQMQPPEWLCNRGIMVAFGIDDGGSEGQSNDGMLHESEIRDWLNLCFDDNEPQRRTDIFQGSGNSFSTNCAKLTHLDKSPHVLFSAVDGTLGCELHRHDLGSNTTSLVFDLNPSGDSFPGRNIGFTSARADSWVYFDANSGSQEQMWAVHPQNWTMVPVLDATLRQPFVWSDGVVMWNQSNHISWTNDTSLNPITEAMLQSSLSDIVMIRDHLTNLGEFFALAFESTLYMSALLDGATQVIVAIDDELRMWNVPSESNTVLSMPSRTQQGTAFIATQGGDKQILHLLDDGGYIWLTDLEYDGPDTTLEHLGDNIGLNYIEERIVFDAVTEGIDAMLYYVDVNSLEVGLLSTELLAVGEQTGSERIGKTIFFDCISAAYGHELCQTDGTSEGTSVIDTLMPGFQSSQPKHVGLVGGQVILLAHGLDASTYHASSLWMVKDGLPTLMFNPYLGASNDAQSGMYGELVISSTHLFFIAQDGNQGHELFVWNILEYDEQWLFI